MEVRTIFLYYIFLLVLILEFIISILLFLKIKNIKLISILLLVINLIAIILSTFIFLDFVPFYILILGKKYFPFTNIVYIIVNILLLLGYSGMDDSFKGLHRTLVGLFFLSNSLGLLVLY